jgi:hypothetical protein
LKNIFAPKWRFFSQITAIYAQNASMPLLFEKNRQSFLQKWSEIAKQGSQHGSPVPRPTYGFGGKHHTISS